ncbi:MAG: leucine-rich repeat domain-containing protein [Clostridia bacterium]|nr:leucine-rich repeat domain-containing protein [Clostridia bacterium]
MKLKRITSLLLAAVMLSTVFSYVAFAAGPDASGALDLEGLFTWTVENGVLTVLYGGDEAAPMPDFTYDDNEGEPVQPWEDYIKEVESIVVSGNVTAIGDYAFYNAFSCSSVTLPEGVKSIGECAFQYTHKLKSISLPTTLEVIEYSAFYCSGLENVIIPEGVTDIGRMAFGYCFKLATADIPSTVTTLSRNVFLLCPRLYAIINRSQSVAVFDQGGEEMVLAFNKVSANEKYAKYLDLELEVSREGYFNVDGDEALYNEIVRRYNEFYGTEFSDIEELTDSFYGNLLPDSLVGDYVTLYCKTGSAQQSFCEENGINYVLIDSGENYCVHRIGVNNYIAPTCTANGYRGGAVCLVCEKVFEEPEIIEPDGHTPEIIPGTPATCTQSGSTDGVKCSVCGSVLTEQQLIMPLGHVDENGDGICDVCEKEIPENEEYTINPIKSVIRFFATIIDRLLAIFRKIFG